MNNQNNKKPNISGMGALPLIIILGLIFGAGYLLLKGEIDLPFGESKTIEVRRLEGFPVKVSRDIAAEDEKIQKVITSEEELIEFLASIDKSSKLTVGEKIDFDKEYLVGMATKVFKAGGREFKIKKVYIDKEKDELLVSGRLKRPDDKCVVTQELNSIVDLVAISKTEKNITFETLIETYICE